MYEQRNSYQQSKEPEMKTTKNGTKLPLIDIKGKQYLQVAHRLVWFREDHPDWGIETDFVEWDKEKKWVVMRASIRNAEGNLVATAIKAETPTQQFTDYLEKAETGAIGRALAMCGYGTQFSPELDEGERLADAPTDPVIPKKQEALVEAPVKKHAYHAAA